MLKYFESSLTGNIIGFISLGIGIIGLIITITTMKSAKRIEKSIEIEKIKAIDKTRFNEYKRNALSKLQNKRRIVLSENTLSYNICNDIISIINDLKGYTNILIPDDLEKLNILYKETKSFSLDIYSLQPKSSHLTPEHITKFDEIISEIINILNKGEYNI